MATLPALATIIGGPISPYVRKVLAVCEMKGVPYQVDPIVPFFGDERFSELNPLRRIPVYIDDQVSVSDSTVICEYLEERFPTPALLPKTPAERARARWIEEFADTRMGDVFIWRIFYEAVINPFIWQRPATRRRSPGLWPTSCRRSWPTWSGCLRRRASCSVASRSQIFPLPSSFATWRGRASRSTGTAGHVRTAGLSAQPGYPLWPRSRASPTRWRRHPCRSIAGSRPSSVCR